jgi:hypothetical protein
MHFLTEQSIACALFGESRCSARSRRWRERSWASGRGAGDPRSSTDRVLVRGTERVIFAR